MPRKNLIAGNWKMNNTIPEAVVLAQEISNRMERDWLELVDVAVCPPFVDLKPVKSVFEFDRVDIAVGAQNVYWEPKGAFTGEISIAMIKSIGCAFCIVGHSERRNLFGETNEEVNLKARALIEADITPIICVGESLSVRDGGTYLDFVTAQVRAAYAGMDAADAARTVVAYEPVWAIGTGRTATPEQAEAAQPEQPDSEQPSEPAADPAAPDDTPVTDAQKTAQATLASMTEDEKLWQLFFVTPEAITNVNTATVAGEATKNALAQYPVGGIVYFAKNLEDRAQAAALLANTQSYAKIPLFLGVDEEGGTVSRIGANEALGGTKVADMRSFGQSADPAQVYAAGQTLAANLTGLGFNLDFAPDCDVVSGVDSVIGSRSFGSDPELCASLAGVIVKSLRAEGIVSCLKHFPGYGSATVDDHNGTSIVEKTLDELESCDLVPFQSIIAQEGSVPFVMVTHLSYPNVTGSDTPADLSSAIVTDILRDKLGYQNVIITDSQSMSSITDHYSAGEAAVQALAAGCDMILMPSDLQGAFDAVKAAVADGTLTQSRIDESVLRILTVKAEYGILQ